MSDLRETLKTEFQEPEYRYAYAESFLNTRLATQIKTLREQRDYTQEEAASLMGIKQPGYRRFEDVNHLVWKTDTLWNIARTYGVRLDISFKTFGSLLDDKEHFNREALKVPAFEEDPAFRERPAKETKVEDILVPATLRDSGVLATPSFGLGGDQEGVERVRAAAAAMWLKPAGSTELGGFANPGVLQLAGSGLLQSPMSRILSFSVSDSTTVSDSASGAYDPAAQPEIIDAVKATSTPAPINTQQSVPEISQPSRPERIENPLRRRAA